MAYMSRVDKVIIGARAVVANGGVVADAGAAAVANIVLAAVPQNSIRRIGDPPSVVRQTGKWPYSYLPNAGNLIIHVILPISSSYRLPIRHSGQALIAFDRLRSPASSGESSS